MRVSGVIATHYHPDHVGGDLGGRAQIAGIVELLEKIDVPIHVQADEVEWVTRRTGVGEDSLVAHDAGDVVNGGRLRRLADPHARTHAGQPVSLGRRTPDQWRHAVPRRLWPHRPSRLRSRGDVPHPDPATLGRLGRHRAFPGHLYSADPSAPMGDVRQHNRALVPASAEQWLAMFAR
jgi:hypothetical protein